MAHIRELQWAVDRGIATPAEKRLLTWSAVGSAVGPEPEG